MASGRRTRLTGAQPPEDGNDTHATPHAGIEREDLSPDVERVLAELGEAASAVVVYRMKDNKPGDWDYVARMSAGEFTTEYVKEQFGGGDYKIIVIDAQQGPLNPVYFSIDRRFVGKLFRGEPAQVVASNGDAFKEQLLQLLLVRVLQPPTVPQKDPMDYALQIAALFKDSNNGGGVGALKDVMELAGMMADRMNPPDGIAGVATQFLPVLERLTHAPTPAATAVRRIPATTVTKTTTPTPATALNPNPPAQVAGSIVPAWLAPFKSIAPMLVTLADTGANPVMYADVALDQISNSETLFRAAVESMQAQRMLSELYALAPSLQANDKRKTFAAELVKAVEEGLQQMIADEASEGAVNNG